MLKWVQAMYLIIILKNMLSSGEEFDEVGDKDTDNNNDYETLEALNFWKNLLEFVEMYIACISLSCFESMCSSLKEINPYYFIFSKKFQIPNKFAIMFIGSIEIC